MSDKPISDLRRRILQDMTNRNFGAKTQLRHVRKRRASRGPING